MGPGVCTTGPSYSTRWSREPGSYPRLCVLVSAQATMCGIAASTSR